MHICVISPVPLGAGRSAPPLAVALLRDMAHGLHTLTREKVFSCSHNTADVPSEVTIFNFRSCRWQSVQVGPWGLLLPPLQQWRTCDAHVHFLYDLSSYRLWHAGTKGRFLNVSESKILQLLSYQRLNWSFKIWCIKWALQHCLCTQRPWSFCSHLFLIC